MLNRPNPQIPDLPARTQALCLLMDSQASPDEMDAACAAWRDDPALRGQWHQWQLIGDVMRSDELAMSPSHDEAFLQSLRGRLTAEPVPLAPSALSDDALPAGPAERHWRTPLAVAAGLVAVVAALAVTRLSAPEASPARGLMAQAPAAAPTRPATVPVAMLRDAGLDRYVFAHRKLPVGAEMPGRAERQVQFVIDTK